MARKAAAPRAGWKPILAARSARTAAVTTSIAIGAPIQDPQCQHRIAGRHGSAAAHSRQVISSGSPLGTDILATWPRSTVPAGRPTTALVATEITSIIYASQRRGVCWKFD